MGGLGEVDGEEGLQCDSVRNEGGECGFFEVEGGGVLDLPDDGVVGLDFCGVERPYPEGDFDGFHGGCLFLLN